MKLSNEEDKKVLLSYLLKLDKLILEIPDPYKILRDAKEGKVEIRN